jgi:Flp pilus assembly pilin Flp
MRWEGTMRLLKKIGNINGQNIVEYAIIVSIISAAMIAMSTYVYRAVQGAQKKVEDEFRKH